MKPCFFIEHVVWRHMLLALFLAVVADAPAHAKRMALVVGSFCNGCAGPGNKTNMHFVRLVRNEL